MEEPLLDLALPNNSLNTGIGMFVQTKSSEFNQLFRDSRNALCLTLLAVTQILFGSGCALTPQYPSQLPAFAPGDEKFMSCPQIAGRYADKGEAFTVEGQRIGMVSLSQLVCRNDSACAATDTVAVLQTEPGVIEIQLFKQEQSFVTQRFFEYRGWGKGGWNPFSPPQLGPTYLCVYGFLDIDAGGEHHGSAGIGFIDFGKDLLLRKAVDGSLIVLQREIVFGIAVIVPFVNRRSAWGRFPTIGDDF